MKTYDIGVATYLVMLGNTDYTVERREGRGCFVFQGETDKMVALAKEYHQGKGQFMLYHTMLRALKGQVNHAPELSEGYKAVSE
jgi:hypothetical protein